MQNQEPTYTIPMNLADEARRRIENANRRLKRAGVNKEFTWIEKIVMVDRQDRPTGAIEFTLSAPSLSFSGWEFIAAVDILESGSVLRSPRGIDTSNIQRPVDHRCDHCGKVRSRKYSYLLQNEDTKEIKQVGKSCLELFLGVSPSALWLLQWDDLEDLQNNADREDWDKSPTVYETEFIVRLAMVISHNGQNYISSDRAMYDDEESTANIVRRVLHPLPNPAAQAESAEIVLAAEDLDKNLIKDAINAAREVQGGYGENLQVVIDSEFIENKHIGLAASVAAVYNRAQEKVAKEKVRKEFSASLVKEYLAEPKEKISGVTVTVTKVIGGFINDYGKENTMLLAVDDDGHLLKWFGSVPTHVGDTEVSPGARFLIDRATVKANDVYQGDYQTVINRVKFLETA